MKTTKFQNVQFKNENGSGNLSALHTEIIENMEAFQFFDLLEQGETYAYDYRKKDRYVLKKTGNLSKQAVVEVCLWDYENGTAIPHSKFTMEYCR